MFCWIFEDFHLRELKTSPRCRKNINQVHKMSTKHYSNFSKQVRHVSTCRKKAKEIQSKMMLKEKWCSGIKQPFFKAFFLTKKTWFYCKMFLTIVSSLLFFLAFRKVFENICVLRPINFRSKLRILDKFKKGLRTYGTPLKWETDFFLIFVIV